MERRGSSSKSDPRLRARLVAVGIVLALSLGAFGSWRVAYLRSRAQAVQNAQITISARAELLAAALTTAMRSIDGAIRSLGERIIVRGTDDPDLPQSLVQLAGSFGELMRVILVVGPDGIVIADSRPGSPAIGIDVADRAYFTAHRAARRSEIFVDLPTLSRVNNQWSLPMSRAIYEADGGLLAVVVASVEPTFFSDILARDVSERIDRSDPVQRIIVSHSDGMILTEVPYSPDMVGKPVSDELDIIPTPSGWATITQSDVGMETIVATSALPAGFGMSIYTDGWPEFQLTSLHARYRMSGVILSLSIVIGGLLAAVIVRSRERLQAETALHRRAAEELSQALDLRDALIREISHRTRNSLAVISSAVQIKAAQFSGNDEARAIATETVQRAQALSLVYQHMDTSGTRSVVSVAPYLRDTGDMIMRTYSDSGAPIHMLYSLDESQLPLDTVTPLGMVLHELLTNAFVHGVGRFGASRISVSFHDVVEPEGLAHVLIIGDNGSGVSEDSNPLMGDTVGFELVREIVTHQLHGSIEITRYSGLELTIRFPSGAANV